MPRNGKGLYLNQKGHIYWVEIPLKTQPLKAFFGKSKFRHNTETDSRSDAEIIAAPVVANFKRIKKLIEQGNLEEARRLHQGERVLTSEERAMIIREAYVDAKDEKERAMIELGAHEEADRIRESGELVDPEDPTNRETTKDGEAVNFYLLATGRRTPTLQYVDAYFKFRTDFKPKTASDYRSTIEKIAKRFPILESITRKDARAYLDKMIADGLKPRNFDRILPAINGYWQWLFDREYVTEEVGPFMNYKRPKKNTKQGAVDGTDYLPWSDEEVLAIEAKILEKSKIDQPLYELIQIGKYTGLRINEIMTLKKEEIRTIQGKRYFTVRDSKTASGIREIPIHDQIAPLVDTLCKASEDGYLIPVKTMRNKYGSRSAAISKRFGNLKQSLGFNSRRKAFHSFRNTLAMKMRHKDIDRRVIADVLGHGDESVTRIYEKHSSYEQLQRAIACVEYKQDS